MAHMAMHITRDLTGVIDIGPTDIGATIEKVPSGDSNPSSSIMVPNMKVQVKQSPFTGLKASARL
jgi:hypothetical protein